MSKRLRATLATLILSSACATTPRVDHLGQGNQFAQDGLYREAIDSYRQAIRLQHDNQTAHHNLGLVLVKVRNYKKAIEHLETAMTAFDGSFEAHFYLAEAYRAEEKYADAIFHYQRALKIQPDEAKALKALSWAYFKIRYYSEALSTVRRLAKLDPDDQQHPIILARILVKLKRYREALATLRKAHGDAGKDMQPYYASVEGDIFYAIGDFARAGKLYRQALKEQPLLAGALLGLGKCLLDEKKTDEAIQFMERALRLRPSLAEAHYLLGKAYETRDPAKSLRYYFYFKKHAATDPELLSLLVEVQKRVGSLKKPEQAPKKT